MAAEWISIACDEDWNDTAVMELQPNHPSIKHPVGCLVRVESYGRVAGSGDRHLVGVALSYVPGVTLAAFGIKLGDHAVGGGGTSESDFTGPLVDPAWAAAGGADKNELHPAVLVYDAGAGPLNDAEDDQSTIDAIHDVLDGYPSTIPEQGEQGVIERVEALAEEHAVLKYRAELEVTAVGTTIADIRELHNVLGTDPQRGILDRAREVVAELKEKREALDSAKLSMELLLGDRSPLGPLPKQVIAGFFYDTPFGRVVDSPLLAKED